IQTSAPISHGSSGGALLDEYARLVGVTVSSMTQGQNLNFAIPAASVSALLDTGYTPRGATAHCEADGELRTAVDTGLEAKEKSPVTALLVKYPCGSEAQRPFSRETRTQEKTLAAAQDALAQGDTATAQLKYREFLRQWPTQGGEAHFGLGEALYAEKSFRD